MRVSRFSASFHTWTRITAVAKLGRTPSKLETASRVQTSRGLARDYVLLAVVTSAASVLSLLHYYRAHEILLYGDAVAHINIARRVFDSLTPGPLQLGTVWLPLPHLLSIPFIVSTWMWRTGVGGSIVSMAAYVAGTLGVYRLARNAGEAKGRGTAAAWFAAAIYAANPNLLYLQATAMTEPLYLALFVWAIVLLAEWMESLQQGPERSPGALEGCALVLAAAMWTRYDGWFLAACVALVIFALRWKSSASAVPPQPILQSRMRAALRNFVLLLAAVAGLWFAYNYREFGNPVEFATGPYSARGVEQRTAAAHDPRHPGSGNLAVATTYFLKAAKLNLGAGRWESPLLLVAIAGALLTIAVDRRRAFLLLLWTPLLFYPGSVAYGGVPIFLPVWWPFSYYNARYGLELLPSVAVFAALGVSWAARARHSRPWRAAVMMGALMLLGGSYTSAWRATPICLREARANGSARQRFELALAHELEKLPPAARLLMSTGDHPGALERAAIPLRRTINETNHPAWEQALADPAHHGDYVVALQGDAVARAVIRHPEALEPVAVVDTPGQPRTTIYKSMLATGR